DQARGGVVQGQAQGVEQRALAGAGRAADREQPARYQRLAGEIDLEFAGQRGQVLAADTQDLHAPSVDISSAKAASWSAGASSPKRWRHRRWKISSGCSCASWSRLRAVSAPAVVTTR